MTVKKVSVEIEGDHFIGTDEFGSIRLDYFEKGITPIKALMASAATCSIMDIKQVLGKRKVEYSVLKADVEAVKEDDPARLTKLHIIFTTDAPLTEMERAVKLSIDRYCTVVNTIKGVTDVTTEIIIV